MSLNFVCSQPGGFAHVYLARIEGKSGYVVLKRVAVPDNERLRTVEKEIAFMVNKKYIYKAQEHTPSFKADILLFVTDRDD